MATSPLSPTSPLYQFLDMWTKGSPLSPQTPIGLWTMDCPGLLDIGLEMGSPLMAIGYHPFNGVR